ncbi:YitT family protein [Kutzneria sp. NPDC052558]|uniref:YitT family protein n=1 Tax=Kutzneria sp. NPDC052558 TaxID=3364121 RepID=UPI0037C6CB44
MDNEQITGVEPSIRVPPRATQAPSRTCLGLQPPADRGIGHRPRPIHRAQCLAVPRPREPIVERKPRVDLLRFGWKLAGVVLGASTTGAGLALMIRARLGAQPWDVLHLALAKLLNVSPGTVIIGMSLLVLLFWWPLRQRPGLGTLAMTFLPGACCDLVLAVVPVPSDLAPRAALLAGGIVVFSVGTALVIKSGLGPGARDGLMTGACARWGLSVRTVRTGLELGVLTLGLILANPVQAVSAGTAGPGTLAIALTLGPLIGVLLKHRFARPQPQVSPS